MPQRQTIKPLNFDLFKHRRGAYARRSDPETSHEAAGRIDAKSIEQRIVSYLADHQDGGTTNELAGWLGLPLVSVSPRMKPLEEKGRVKRSVRRRNRSIVWVKA